LVVGGKKSSFAGEESVGGRVEAAYLEGGAPTPKLDIYVGEGDMTREKSLGEERRGGGRKEGTNTIIEVLSLRHGFIPEQILEL